MSAREPIHQKHLAKVEGDYRDASLPKTFRIVDSWSSFAVAARDMRRCGVFGGGRSCFPPATGIVATRCSQSSGSSAKGVTTRGGSSLIKATGTRTEPGKAGIRARFLSGSYRLELHCASDTGFARGSEVVAGAACCRPCLAHCRRSKKPGFPARYHHQCGHRRLLWL